MRWFDLGDGFGALELPDELELLVFWGDGEPTRAAWVWSQSGRLVLWSTVGEA